MKIKKAHLIIAIVALFIVANFPVSNVFASKAHSWTELQSN